MVLSPPTDAVPVHCGVCKRYLGRADGTYVQPAPCPCGVRTTVEFVGKRAQQSVQMAGERLEVKGR